jgi:hypothetical protein
MAKRNATINPIRTSREEFLKVYAKALKNGWTREQCASEMGIKPESVYARCLAEKAKGNTIKPLPVASRKVNTDEINSLLAEICIPSGVVDEPEAPARAEDAHPVTENELAEALDFLE